MPSGRKREEVLNNMEEKKQVSEKEEVDKLVKSISDNISAQLANFRKISAENEAKKKMVSPEIKMIDSDVKIYKTKKGKILTMKKSQLEYNAKWLKALLNKDRYGMNKIAEEIRTKWEPLNETTAAEGGTLVPVLLSNILVDILEDTAVIRPRAYVINMQGMKTDTLTIPTIASKPITQWGSEQAQKATSSMTFGSLTLTPYRLAAIVPITTELRDDSPFNIVQIVTKALGEAIAKSEDLAFATGNGTGRPTGITAYTMASVVNALNTLTFDHFSNAYWRMPQAYRSNAVWIMNGRTISALATIKDSQNRPLLLESGIITEPGTPAIKGRPVLEQNDLPSASIYFIDLSQYFVADKGGVKIDISEEATVAGYNLWERNMLAIRCEERVDGELATTRAGVQISNTGIS